MSIPTTILPFQPATMSTAQLAAVSYLARYSGRTHALYSFQLQQWFSWCESNALDPLVGIQRAHVELYIRQLGDHGLMDSSIVTMMHAVRGYFRFAHIDGLIPADPAVYARLPKIHRDESRTQGRDRLELIRFLQVAQTVTVHHGALAFLLGIKALRASEAAAVRIKDYADTLRGYRVLRLTGKGNKPATMPLTVPVLRVLEACRGQRVCGPLILRPISGQPINRRDVYRMVARIAKTAAIPRHISPHSLRHAAITNALDAGVPLRDAQILARHADPRTTEHYDRARGNLDRHGVHFLTAYLPYDQLLPLTAVVVSNGGRGGVQQALRHAVPLVIAGDSEDKPEVAARVRRCGAGMQLRTGTPSPRRIRTAVQHVLHDPTYRRNAIRMRDLINDLGDPRSTIADTLERAAAEHKPFRE